METYENYTRRELLKTRAIIDRSLYCVIARYWRDSLSTYIISHNMLHGGQSGFRAKHSCEIALNHMVHNFASAIYKGLMNGVVVLDLRKAFDLVNHTVFKWIISSPGA